MKEKIRVVIDKFTLEEAVRPAFSRQWTIEHPELAGQVPQYSNAALINHVLNYYIGQFMKQ